jgi:molybdopterin converting factor subunit 1
MESITVKLILFAGLRQVAGFKEQDFSLPPGATVADLLAQLPPAVTGRTFYVAVNQEYAETATPLAHGDEVALLPPVSGGRS